MDCIFCKIRDGEIKKEFTYEDEDIMVFPDISPVRPVHLLIVSKEHVADFLKLENNKIWIKIKDVAQQMIQEKELGNKGYRLTLNGGGAQIIEHLHIHLSGPVGKIEKV